MSRLILKINDTAMVAVLHEDKASNTCRVLTQLMALEGHVIQTRWSGEETLGEQAAWEGARPIVIRLADSSEG